MVEYIFPGNQMIHYEELEAREAVWFLKKNASNLIDDLLMISKYTNDYGQVVDSNKVTKELNVISE